MLVPLSRLRILGYHNMGVAPSEAKSPDLYVSQENFAKQMWLLKRVGLKGVCLTEALKSIREQTRTKCIGITFDDGYVDNLELAAPVLKDLGFSATCYLVSDCIGTYNRWDADKLCVRKPLMTYKQVESWLAHGMEIGSHTRTHRRLDLIDSTEASDEIAGSKEILSKFAGQPINHFCYPYGRYDQSTVKTVKQAGYLSATTTRPGAVADDSDPHQLARVFVGGGTGGFKFAAKVALAR